MSISIKENREKEDLEDAQAGQVGCPPVRLFLLGRRAGLRLTMADEHQVRSVCDRQVD